MMTRPGPGWRWARRAAQLLAVIALLGAPFLGGWQRLERNEMATWEAGGYDLPAGLRARLPGHARARRAYGALYLQGGGVAADYLSVPAVDPVAGSVALIRSGASLRFAIGLLIPIALALLLGRVFCGWLCPFGSLSRGIGYLLERLPWRPPLRVPARRPIRWIILGVAVTGSALGAHLLLFIFLPHLLMQQSAYGMWLLGGGGAILGGLIGLVAAGLIFGPTIYCAALCPTGAALSLFGHARRVRLTIASPKDCGTHCDLCSRACWLDLEPASGDPGPDCDLCARCSEACPRLNLRVGTGAVRRRHLPVIMAGLLLGLATEAAAAPARPTIALRGEITRDDVVVAVTMIDEEGTSLYRDNSAVRRGVVLSVFIARGAPPAPDRGGSIARRPFYSGPLAVELHSGGNKWLVRWSAPTNPISTIRRSIYRRRLDLRAAPGYAIVIRPIPGWLEEPARFEVPGSGVGRGLEQVLMVALIAALIFGGLISLALAVPDRGRPRRSLRLRADAPPAPSTARAGP